MSKPRIVRVALALPLLVLGTVPLMFGFFYLLEWRAERTALVLCSVFFFLSGLTILVSGLWLLVSLGRERYFLWTGGVALMVSAALLIGGSLTDLLPCSGPD